MSKKKILILIDWFYPGFKAGGPVQSCLNFIECFKNEYDIFVLTTDTDHLENQPYESISSNTWFFSEEVGVHICYLEKSTICKSKIKKEILCINPDFIYLNHLYSPYFVLLPLWLRWTNQISQRIILCPRGALFDSAISVKSYKKKPLIHLLKWLGIHKQIRFHATNHREEQVIQKHFPGSEILVAENLPNLKKLPFHSIEKKVGSLKCIFVGRLVSIKNLDFLLTVLLTFSLPIELTIVGPIEDPHYWNLCKKKVEQLPKQIRVNYNGTLTPSQVRSLILEHHLFILPTKGENFGHAIFEALSCGRPILISDQTPWRDLSEKKAGWDIPLSEPEQYAKVLKDLVESNQQKFDDFADSAWQYAHQFIQESTFVKDYRNLFS